MQITILAYGSRGDVQPYLALGLGLKWAGHAVRLAAPEQFEAWVRGYGLDFAGLPGDPAELVRLLLDRARNNPFKLGPVVVEYALPMALDMMSRVQAACADADLVIHSFLLASAGHMAARQRGVPDMGALLYPIFASTAHFPPPMFNPLPGNPALYNRLAHALVRFIFDSSNRLPYAWLRRKHLDLLPLGKWPFDGPRPSPILYGFSPHVIPPPPDWPPSVHVTGYWFLDTDSGWQPPDDLLAYLDAGPPPVYVGFGSTVGEDMADVDRIAVEALRSAGQRGILMAGWAGIGDVVGAADDVFVLDTAPHDWLFPRMAAVAHHGGAGTTATGLRSGVPSILIPFGNDQPFWGRIVQGVGVGPAPIPRRKLTAERLAAAIRQAITDQAMRDRAAESGGRIRAEDGVARAVEAINRYLDKTVP